MLSTPRFNVDKFNIILQNSELEQQRTVNRKRKRNQSSGIKADPLDPVDVESNPDIQRLLQDQLHKQEYYV